MNAAIVKVAAVTFLTSFVPLGALAQSIPERAIPTMMEYTRCLPASVGQHWNNSPQLDPDTAAEGALQACLKEERALYVLLSEIGLAQRDTEAALATIKFDFRHLVCVILNDPGYLQSFKAKPHPKCVEVQNRPHSKSK
jgi:hypothetical protein